jgi:NADH-quinone oxidoreductase subunit F
LDLHFTDAIATADERDAVDEILGQPDSRWEGGARDGGADHSAEGGHSARGRRHLLLPVLHAVQDRIGWISPGALNYICVRLTIPPADAYGVASFYALLSTEPQPPTVIHICDDIACKTRGADSICAHLVAHVGPSGKPCGSQAVWKRSPCLGLCEKAPAAFFQCAGTDRHNFTVAPITAADAEAALRGDMQAPMLSARRAATPMVSPVGAGDH